MDDYRALLAALKAQIGSMSDEERRALAMSLCSAVNSMAEHIIENADAIWESRTTPTLH